MYSRTKRAASLTNYISNEFSDSMIEQHDIVITDIAPQISQQRKM